MKISSLRPRHLGFVAILLLGGCLAGTPSPGTAERLRLQAEALASTKNIGEAAATLAEAIASDPTALSLYLRRGEFLEALGRSADALRTYNDGLRRAKPSDPLKPELAWRLGLLEVLQMNRAGEARRLLAHLPEEGPLRDDLQGTIDLKAGDPRRAIAHFGSALKKGPSHDVSGAIYLHCAMAYDALEDRRNSFGALYHAINNASHLGVVRQIEALWGKLNVPSGPQGALR